MSNKSHITLQPALTYAPRRAHYRRFRRWQRALVMPPGGSSLAAVGGAHPRCPRPAGGRMPELSQPQDSCMLGGAGSPHGSPVREGRAGAQPEPPALISQAISAPHRHK